MLKNWTTRNKLESSTQSEFDCFKFQQCRVQKILFSAKWQT
ncbi:MAG: hypothetical protein RLZZ350_321 [Verrucomicrobiota bacterium]